MYTIGKHCLIRINIERGKAEALISFYNSLINLSFNGMRILLLSRYSWQKPVNKNGYGFCSCGTNRHTEKFTGR